jgi:hypothetical protein
MKSKSGTGGTPADASPPEPRRLCNDRGRRGNKLVMLVTGETCSTPAGEGLAWPQLFFNLNTFLCVTAG